MKVSELIELLKEMPQDAEVEGEYFDSEGIFMREVVDKVFTFSENVIIGLEF